MARIKIDNLTPTRTLDADALRLTVGGHANHGSPLPITPLIRARRRKKPKKKVRRS